MVNKEILRQAFMACFDDLDDASSVHGAFGKATEWKDRCKKINSWIKDQAKNASGSKGKSKIEEIIDADMYDNFVSYIEEMYDDGIGLTELNDILRFDGEQVKKDIGIVSWDDFKDLVDKKAIDKAEKVINEIEDKWEEFKDSDENKDDDGNTIYDEIEDWVNDEYSQEPYSLVRSAVDLIESEVDKIADDEEKSDDWDSMVEAITRCGLEYEFKDFDDIVDMVNELDSWIMDSL